MNPAIQKYGPPVIVLGVTLYLGWPPSKPIDLGEELVQARAVRWKPADLESPIAPGRIGDPFRPVLVAREQPQAAAELTQQPVGPGEDEIRAVISLTGIAQLGGRSWAIVNGKARLAGDIVRTPGKTVKACKVLAVHPDHIVVQCQQTFAVVRPQVSRGSVKNNPAAAAVVTPVKQTNSAPALNSEPPAPDVGPPPQASIERPSRGAIHFTTKQV